MQILSKHIAIDARFYGVTGIGRYLENLISELESVDTVNRYTIFLRAAKMGAYKPTNDYFSPVEAEYPWYSFIEQIGFLKKLYAEKYDLVHFAHLNVPVLYLRPFVVTIHDLIMHDASKGATTRNSLYFRFKKLVYRMLVRWTAYRAKAIIVPTNLVKDTLVDRLGVPADKIHVTYEAVDATFKEHVHKDAEVLKKYGIRRPYLLYVSSFYEHKNHRRLIEAFELLALEGYEYEGAFPQLVLVGKQDAFAEKLQQYVKDKGLEHSVLFPGQMAKSGYTPDEDMKALLAQAFVYVCPSLQEGFGITFLEAMAMRIPTILSDASCIPEVAGDAGYFINARKPVEIKEAIKRLLGDESLRSELVSLGTKRVNEFSWKKMAEETLGVYRGVFDL